MNIKSLELSINLGVLSVFGDLGVKINQRNLRNKECNNEYKSLELSINLGVLSVFGDLGGKINQRNLRNKECNNENKVVGFINKPRCSQCFR